jgi:hypothetical protein
MRHAGGRRHAGVNMCRTRHRFLLSFGEPQISMWGRKSKAPSASRKQRTAMADYASLIRPTLKSNQPQAIA